MTPAKQVPEECATFILPEQRLHARLQHKRVILHQAFVAIAYRTAVCFDGKVKQGETCTGNVTCSGGLTQAETPFVRLRSMIEP